MSLWDWEGVLLGYDYRWWVIREEIEMSFAYEMARINELWHLGMELPWRRPPRFTVEH